MPRLALLSGEAFLGTSLKFVAVLVSRTGKMGGRELESPTSTMSTWDEARNTRQFTCFLLHEIPCFALFTLGKGYTKGVQFVAWIASLSFGETRNSLQRRRYLRRHLRFAERSTRLSSVCRPRRFYRRQTQVDRHGRGQGILLSVLERSSGQ